MIDTATRAVSATIPVGPRPIVVAITPDGKHAYVTNQGDDTVSVIDTATGAVSATIPVGPAPSGVAITPDGKHVYVANNGSGLLGTGVVDNTVSVIDTATGVVSATITVGNGPVGVAVDSGRQARLRGQRRRQHGVGDRYGDGCGVGHHHRRRHPRQGGDLPGVNAAQTCRNGARGHRGGEPMNIVAVSRKFVALLVVACVRVRSARRDVGRTGWGRRGHRRVRGEGLRDELR